MSAPHLTGSWQSKLENWVIIVGLRPKLELGRLCTVHFVECELFSESKDQWPGTNPENHEAYDSIQDAESFTIRPSSSVTMRSASSRMRLSWVTMTVVVPRTCPQSFEHFNNNHTAFAVQCGCRLIGKDNIRIAHKRPGDGNALLLAT